MARRPWLIPVVASVAAVALSVAGVVAWRMTSSPAGVDVGRVAVFVRVQHHRLHPIRAELLWAASALFALVVVGVALRQWRRPGGAQTFSG